jgi:hypothetical protein
MKKAILTALFASILLLHSASDAQALLAKSNINTSSSPVFPVTVSSPVGAAPAISQQATATPSSTAPSSPTIAPPADIASLTAKEILSANNQVVNQVASMYQNLGLFITIIVTLVGGVATWMSYVARKSVHEFIQEWTKKLESVENEMKESLKRLRVAVAEADASAKKAAGHEQSIEDSTKVVNKTLKDIDALKLGVASLSAQVRGEEVSAVAQPATEAGGDQPVSEPLAAEEDAEVAARLKDKINSSKGGGQKP